MIYGEALEDKWHCSVVKQLYRCRKALCEQLKWANFHLSQNLCSEPAVNHTDVLQTEMGWGITDEGGYFKFTPRSL